MPSTPCTVGELFDPMTALMEDAIGCEPPELFYFIDSLLASQSPQIGARAASAIHVLRCAASCLLRPAPAPEQRFAGVCEPRMQLRLPCGPCRPCAGAHACQHSQCSPVACGCIYS